MNRSDNQTLPAEVQGALEQVLDHLWDGESQSFALAGPEERGGHVFNALTTLRSWLAPQFRLPEVPAVTAKGTRRFSARLGYFVAEAVITDQGNGERAYHVTADLDGPSPGGQCKPMEFRPATADDVLDLFEVVDASNELIEELVRKDQKPEPKGPTLQVVAQGGPRRAS